MAVVVARTALSGLLYVYRVRAYAKKDVDLKERMTLLHKHEQVGGSDD